MRVSTDEAVCQDCRPWTSLSIDDLSWGGGARMFPTSLCKSTGEGTAPLLIGNLPPDTRVVHRGTGLETDTNGVTLWTPDVSKTGVLTLEVFISSADGSCTHQIVHNMTVEWPEVQLEDMKLATCSGCPDGSFGLRPINPADTYDYRMNGGTWDTTQSEALYNGLRPNTYRVEMKTPSGCRDEMLVSVGINMDCATPAGLSFSDIDAYSARAEWPVIENARRYVVEIKPNSPAVKTWLAFTVREGDARSMLPEGLRPGTDYVARIKTRCRAADSEYGPVVSFQTPLMREGAVMLASGNLTLTCYPNPARDQITVSYDLSGQGEVVLSVLSIDGRSLLRTTTATEQGEHRLDLSGIYAGLYLLEVQTTSGSRSVLKFIVTE